MNYNEKEEEVMKREIMYPDTAPPLRHKLRRRTRTNFQEIVTLEALPSASLLSTTSTMAPQLQPSDNPSACNRPQLILPINLLQGAE